MRLLLQLFGAEPGTPLSSPGGSPCTTARPLLYQHPEMSRARATIRKKPLKVPAQRSNGTVLSPRWGRWGGGRLRGAPPQPRPAFPTAGALRRRDGSGRNPLPNAVIKTAPRAGSGPLPPRSGLPAPETQHRPAHTHRALALASSSQSVLPQSPSPPPPSAAMSTRSVSSSSYRRMFGGPVGSPAGRMSSTRSYVTTSTRTYSLGSALRPSTSRTLYTRPRVACTPRARLCACGAACPACGCCRTRWTSRWPTPSTPSSRTPAPTRRWSCRSSMTASPTTSTRCFPEQQNKILAG